MVDETVGCELLSFMENFMCKEYEEKTSFITPDGVFCYMVMAFHLRNSGATYQRMVNKLFRGFLGSTMEAYVDDMLVKSRSKETHTTNLA